MITDFIKYGFPLGLDPCASLISAEKNHSSSYQYFKTVDKFLQKEVKLGGASGPYGKPPFPSILVSPLMTAPKGDSARRAVFDGSHGPASLNAATPQQAYLGEEYDFGFPAVSDLCNHIRDLGRGCLIYKRDLSRFFMQIPLCPSEY